MPERTIGILPALKAIRLPNGNLVLLGRFLSGMAAYRRYWGDGLLAIMEPAPASTLETDLDRTLSGDNVEIDPKDLDFELELLDYHDSRMLDVLGRCDVVLAGVFYRQTHLADMARSAGTAIIYNSEYTLKTRLQVARAEEANPLTLARRIAWEINLERLHRQAIQKSDGLQANGVPTYEAYRDLTPSPLLYYDGRMTEDMVVPREVLDNRLQYLLQGEPLRLTWSGRMNKMKGADELLKVAQHLKAMSVPFTLDIYGGGLLEAPMRETLAKENLSDCVTLKGFIPFEDLIRINRTDYDLWLCCHPQGDPSGAYLETLGNGLPMVGYANEAMAGLLARVNAGRAVPIYNAEAMAKLVRTLSRERARLVEWSRAGVSFARNHTFDKTFHRRIDHIEQVLRDTAQTTTATSRSDRRMPPPAADATEVDSEPKARACFVERHRCISCGCAQLTPLWSSTFSSPDVTPHINRFHYAPIAYKVLRGERFQLVRCTRCEMTFHQRILDDTWQQVLYEGWIDSEQIVAAERTLGQDDRFQFDHGIQRIKHILRLRELLEARFRGQPRVLDFGCGDGQFVYLAKTLGFNAVGVDMSATRELRAHALGISVVPSLEDLEPGDTPLHAVTLFEVLEHLPRPLEVLTEIAQLMAPGALLIVEVPDCTGIERPRTFEQFQAVAPTEHINNFTPKTLKTLCERAGFRVVHRQPAWVTTSPRDLLKTALSKMYQPSRTAAYFERP